MADNLPHLTVAQKPASPEPSPEISVTSGQSASMITNPTEEPESPQETRMSSEAHEPSFAVIKSEFLGRRRRRFEREVKFAWQEETDPESSPTLFSRLLLEELYVDKRFPPDISSLSYVYSGEDKYENMHFKRPWEISSDAVFSGVGGTCLWPFPWIHWRDKGWFQGAMAIASLSVKWLEKLIPGYRNFQESFQEDYFGAFLFRLWRFGRWQEIMIDDYLPLLDNDFAYCSPVGERKEYWAPLLEKAYAKCNQTYESIENGNILDALTDLSGAICEYFTPDVNPPHNLFRLLNISCYNRSLIVCWRSEKRLTPIGFIVYQPASSLTSGWKDSEDSHRYLHIVTAATKFQTTDGRMLEMVRLKCPFPSEPKWCGRFSESDKTIWETINQDFMERYQPLQNKDEDEYWLTVEDFRCNFGSMIICSSSEPYIQEGLNVSRKYNRSDQHFVMQNQHQTPQLTKAKNACLKVRSWSLTYNYPSETSSSSIGDKKETASETFARRKISPENTPGSADSFKSLFDDKIFQYERATSPTKSPSPELFISKKSPMSSPPFTGIRKIPYQPPGRSPLASDGSLEEQSNEARSENAAGDNQPEKKPSGSLSQKLASPSQELLQRDCDQPLSIDTTPMKSSSSPQASHFLGSVNKGSDMFRFSQDRTPPTSPKSDDETLKSLPKSTSRAKTSKSFDEILKIQSSAKNTTGSPTLRPKTISLRPFARLDTAAGRSLKGSESTELFSSDSSDPNRSADVSNTKIIESSSLQSPQMSAVSTQVNKNDPQQQIFLQATILPHSDEISSTPLQNIKEPKQKLKSDTEPIVASPSKIDVSLCSRKSDAEIKDKPKGKIIFKSCISTDEEEDDDESSPRKKSLPKIGRKGSAEQSSEKRVSSSDITSVEQILPNQPISSENEDETRSPPSVGKVTSQGSQSGEISDFGSLVQIVKKVRIKNAVASRMTPPGGQDVLVSQSASPNRKLGRYERLAMFCHSSNDGPHPVPDSAPTSTSQETNVKPVVNQARKISLGTIGTLSESNFLASKMDRFSALGGWSQLVNYYGTWHKRKSDDDLDLCPRVLLALHKMDPWKIEVDPAFTGKSHVIISLLQDYRHGSSTANSLLQPIGFKLYKSKYPEKDERRSLSKLNLVCKETSNGVRRELVKRVNLEQGNYFIVPFCQNKDHEGEFMIRILGERNAKEDKPDWYQNILRVLTSVANSPAP